ASTLPARPPPAGWFWTSSPDSAAQLTRGGAFSPQITALCASGLRCWCRPLSDDSPGREAKTMKSFNPVDFLKALSEDSLGDPLFLEGIVKPEQNDDVALLFSEGISCRSWRKVTTDLIVSVEFLGMRSCKDLDPPFLRLQLKEPPKDNALA